MAASDAFLAVVRGMVENLPELTAFRAAGALADETRAERTSRYGRVNAVGSDGLTPITRLGKAIRDTVNGQADVYSSYVSPADRDSAYTTLVAEYVPTIEKPLSDTQELAALTTAINEGILR